MFKIVTGKNAMQLFRVADQVNFPVYKYLKRDDLQFWLEKETIRLSTLKSYADTGNSKGGVADPMEIELIIPEIHIDSSHSKKTEILRSNLEKFGEVKFDNSGFGATHNFSIHQMTIIKPNSNLLCFSKSYSKQAFQKWSKLEGYDTIIKINNICQLMSEISLWANFSSKVFDEVMFDFVQYEQFPVDISRIDVGPLEYLKNKEEFYWQDEVRIIWKSSMGILVEPMNVKIPDLLKHIEIIKIPDDWKNTNYGCHL